MKLAKYESKVLVFAMTFILALMFVLITMFSFNDHIRIYKVINASVIKDNLVEALVTDKELKTIYHNKYLFVDKKKRLIKIERIDRNILKRESKNYHNVLLKVNLNSKVKTNDLVALLFFDKKVDVISMIKIVWKGV